MLNSVAMAENRLTQWLKGQYGPDKPHKSGRQLSLAVSEGRNENLVFDIESRGTARPETLQNLAQVLGVPVMSVYKMAGWLPEESDSDEIDINDPEMSMFFRGYDIEDFTEEEKNIIRTGIRMAKAARQAREQEDTESKNNGS